MLEGVCSAPAGSQPLYRRIIGWALDTTIPASVVVHAISVIFAVWFVVFLIVRDEVIECEAVVTRHEVHAILGLAFLVTVNLGATEQPVGKGRHRTLVATEKAADIV